MKHTLFAAMILASASSFAAEPTFFGCWYSPSSPAEHLELTSDSHFTFITVENNQAVTTTGKWAKAGGSIVLTSGSWEKVGENMVLTMKDNPEKITLAIKPSSLGMTLTAPDGNSLVKGDEAKCN